MALSPCAPVRPVLRRAFQAIGGLKDGVFDHPAHFHDLRLDRFEIAIKRGSNMLLVHV